MRLLFVLIVLAFSQAACASEDPWPVEGTDPLPVNAPEPPPAPPFAVDCGLGAMGTCSSGVTTSATTIQGAGYLFRASGGSVREFRPVRGLFSRLRDRIGSRLGVRAGGCG